MTLLHLIERDAPSEVHSERHLVFEDEASAYLDEVAHLSVLAGIRVSTHVHTSSVSDVAESITGTFRRAFSRSDRDEHPWEGRGPTASVREPRSAGYRTRKDPGTGSAPSRGAAKHDGKRRLAHDSCSYRRRPITREEPGVSQLAVFVMYELEPGEDWFTGLRASANAVARNRTIGNSGGR